MESINVDYIGVIVEQNGKFRYEKYKIEKSEGLINELEGINNNPNKSLLDIQDCFMRAFPKGKAPDGFCYCIPYDYDTSYYNGANYPEIWSFEDWNQLAEKSQYKHYFFYECIGYIQSYDYDKALKAIKADKATKMYSSDITGWTSFEHKIDKDCIITVKTNFAYGSSSYFFVNVRYKGIDILPFSDVIKYYKANMDDFIRYTRQYTPKRENWQAALDFVESINNLRVEDEVQFVKTWIMNEVEEMVSGLSNYINNAKYYLGEFAKCENHNTEYTDLYNITNIDKEKYRVCPDEMALAFKVEKISSALFLLNKLMELQPIYNDVINQIARIKQLNEQIYQEIAPNIERIQCDIDKAENEVAKLNEEITSINGKIALHEDEIEALCKDISCNSEQQEIATKYKEEHPEYTNLMRRLKELSSEKYEKQRNITYRKGFINQLTTCKTRIEDALSLE